MKLYEKYSKLKSAKDRELDQVNQEQEIKFLQFQAAADDLTEHLTTEVMTLSANIDELREEIVKLRSAKDRQYDEFQQKLMEEKQKNRELSAEVEQLRHLQQERPFSGNRIDQHEEQNASSSQRSPAVSRAQFNETPMRVTRKRARLSMDTDSAINSGSPGPREHSAKKRLHFDQPKRDASNSYVQPQCCQSNIDNEGPCKCLFQNFVECLIGMKVSIANQPEGRCIHAVHQSGYSFNLTWVSNASLDGELLYRVTSLGTLVNVAPEWMREFIIFSMSMCPVFFERISRIIKLQ